MASAGAAVHRTIIAVDVEGFGDRRRTNRNQVAVRDGLYGAMGEAFGQAEISWDDCHREDRGDAGRAAEALPLHQQTLTVRERVLGADHSDTLGSRNNLAVAYAASGRAAEAIPLYEQVLAACERVLGQTTRSP